MMADHRVHTGFQCRRHEPAHGRQGAFDVLGLTVIAEEHDVADIEAVKRAVADARESRAGGG